MEDVAISVGGVSELLASLSNKGAVEELAGKTVVDLSKAGYSKLLGDGELTRPLTIKVHRASESAIKKVEQAGGAVELLTKAAA
jgi:large subunit ribosomal protein L15